MSSYSKFLRRVRIHGRECGAVARALRHKIEANPLSAVDRKVLFTTNERKVMSKTTFFKRIALTAIAALGLGMLSVAPSQAVSNLTVSGTNGTATLSSVGGKTDSSTAATVTVNALMDTRDSVTVTFVEKSVPTGSAVIARMYFNETTTALASSTKVETTTTGASLATAKQAMTTWQVPTDSHTGIVAGGSAGNVILLSHTSNGYVGAKFFLQLDSTTTRIKGTYTYTVIVKTFNADDGSMLAAESTTTQDVSIVISDTAANTALVSGTIDPAKSTAVLNAGVVADGGFSTTDSSVAVVATASATVHASIQVKTMTSTSLPAPESVTVTITGPGLVKSGSVSGKSITIIGTGGNNILDIIADGTAGVASIVVKTTTVTFPAKNVTFYAKAAKTITVTSNAPVINVGTNLDVIRATALDANGNVWGGAAYIYADTAADALIAGSNATPVACSFDSALGLHKCPVTGTAKGTANLKVIDAATVALATATSAAATTRVSTGVPTTAVLSFDKATYTPGERAQVRVQILDAEGLMLGAKTVTNAFTADIASSKAFFSGSLSGSASPVIDAATSATLITNAGHDTFDVYMPMSDGVVTLTATGSTGLALSGRVALTASATVVDTGNLPAIAAAEAATDAANEAIDAANAATDAANLAAEAADAATVAAEEARDAADAATAAVEALATEVATLMAALKAQITTLANTVAKIAKKVKA